MIIPQGGVHPASLEHNARRFPEGLAAGALPGREAGEPEGTGSIGRSSAGSTTRPAATRVVAVSEFVRGHLEATTTASPATASG